MGRTITLKGKALDGLNAALKKGNHKQAHSELQKAASKAEGTKSDSAACSTHITPTEEGMQAAKDNKQYTANPYGDDDVEYYQWLSGWADEREKQVVHFNQ